MLVAWILIFMPYIFCSFVMSNTSFMWSLLKLSPKQYQMGMVIQKLDKHAFKIQHKYK